MNRRISSATRMPVCLESLASFSTCCLGSQMVVRFIMSGGYTLTPYTRQGENHRNGLLSRFSISKTVLRETAFLLRLPRGEKSKTFAFTSRSRL